MTDPTNRKPADRLADLRERIKALEVEEAQLRDGFISGELPPQGDEHTVVIEHKTNQRVDLRAMRQNVAQEVWAPFLIESEAVYVTVRRRA